MTTPATVRLVETLRDAWQGLPRVLPTESKVAFAQRLLDLGFPRLDVGSFVSPSRVPTMADTGEVLSRLRVPAGTRLTALVASESGLQRLLAVRRSGGAAPDAPAVSEVLYPFSLSENFQRRNTERGREDAFALLESIVAGAHGAGRTVYATISMAFGNNEGDPFDPAELREWVARMHAADEDRVGLADTTAMASPSSIASIYATVMRDARWPVPAAHLHVSPQNQRALVDAALDAGGRDLDAALGALGGCQFAKGAVSNVSTLPFARHVAERGLSLALPAAALAALPELAAAAQALAAG
ncbi:MAG: hydroxymethylglutaryl-CoA lyase [Casimicrobiaceae bacterium]